MGRHVALLRGINVGGNNKVPMKALAQLFVDEGCSEVRTFIQSGNVIFAAARAQLGTLSERIVAGIATRFGVEVPVVLRSAEELARVAERNPFPAADAAILHVMFLRDQPAAKLARALDADRSPPDSFALVGRDLYLRCPNGVARTKLTNAYFDRALGTVSTARNWRTVQKLAELARG